jgi:HEPN/RES N-terminal domain 1/RES domain
MEAEAVEYEQSDLQESYPDKFVCAACFEDEHVKTFVESCVESRTCSYCGRRSRTKDIAAPVDAVIEHLFEGLSRHYGEAWASGASWDNEDQRYFNETWDTDDLLQTYLYLAGDSDELYQNILDAFPSGDWCRINPWSATDSEILKWGWERFVDVVKYERRFFFTRGEDRDELNREDMGPSELLYVFGNRCAYNGLVTTIPTGTKILRCRPRQARKERFTRPRDLGPPPSRLAKQNRMSPAGISMFYGAADKKTTLSEMPERPEYYAIGTFLTLRALTLLDLTNIMSVSIFDDSEYADYHWSAFMRDFLRDFTKPIKRDDRVHIDYIPTQIVTEYLRDADILEGRPIDGIKFRSARNKRGICYVLFIDQYGVEPREDDLADQQGDLERWKKPKVGYALKLVSIRHSRSQPSNAVNSDADRNKPGG